MVYSSNYCVVVCYAEDCGNLASEIVSSSQPPAPAGHPDRLIAAGACDPGYDEDTIAGYVFPEPPLTGHPIAIYRCRNNRNATHWVSRSGNCEGIGTMEGVLGFGLLP